MIVGAEMKMPITLRGFPFPVMAGLTPLPRIESAIFWRIQSAANTTSFLGHLRGLEMDVIKGMNLVKGQRSISGERD